jgi:hypothetical protein
MRADLCLSISTPWNGASLAKMYQKERDSRSAQKTMLTVIWGVDGFHIADLMTSQNSFNLSTSSVMPWHRWLRKFFPGGEFHILVNYNFTWITSESTFQRPLSNLSLKMILDMYLRHLTVLVLHHRTSGFSVNWTLRLLAILSTSENSCWRQSPSFWTKFIRQKWVRFSATG